jgi:hypothetical protein
VPVSADIQPFGGFPIFQDGVDLLTHVALVCEIGRCTGHFLVHTKLTIPVLDLVVQ